MRSEIISIGTELLLGEITDTNASFLASELPLLGIDLYWVTQVGDNLGRICEALNRAINRSDIVFTTGGLGPTDDDLTREAISTLLNEEMEVDSVLLAELRDFFAKRGLEMPQRNIKQATLISSAKAIPNPRGTAPGWWVENKGKIIIAMPGPPGEMQRMWLKELKGRLAPLLTGQLIVSRTIKTYGLSEAKVDELISPFSSSTNPTYGVYAKPDGIQVRIAVKSANREDADRVLIEHETKLMEILGKNIWGKDEDILEQVVGDLLVIKRLTLATMESCTGGLLSSTITDVPGSSRYFKGGLVTYSVEMKVRNGVNKNIIDKFGAISPETAREMAIAVRNAVGADIGIGITGIAGPDELEGKPVGTVYIGISSDKKTTAIKGNYPPQRPQVKRRAVLAALFGLRELLLDVK